MIQHENTFTEFLSPLSNDLKSNVILLSLQNFANNCTYNFRNTLPYIHIPKIEATICIHNALCLSQNKIRFQTFFFNLNHLYQSFYFLCPFFIFNSITLFGFRLIISIKFILKSSKSISLLQCFVYIKSKRCQRRYLLADIGVILKASDLNRHWN